MTSNEEIFEAVCAEFNDNLFEDKWADIPDSSISKAQIRIAMKRALNKLATYIPIKG